MPEHTPAPTPSRAIYGFILFLLFKTLFIIYIFWAFLPEEFLRTKLGLTYLPDKYFALYVPILVLCGVTFFAFLIYPALSLALTASIDHISTIKDDFSIKRCEYAGPNGIWCDQKVTTKTRKGRTTANSWEREKYCLCHLDRVNNGMEQENVESKIKEYCDCLDKEHCLLNTNETYLNNLRKRKMVPNVSDLDISDVCKVLYGNK